eukprot:942807-Rhodomonas_salina.2
MALGLGARLDRAAAPAAGALDLGGIIKRGKKQEGEEEDSGWAWRRGNLNGKFVFLSRGTAYDYGSSSSIIYKSSPSTVALALLIIVLLDLSYGAICSSVLGLRRVIQKPLLTESPPFSELRV